MRCLMPMFWEEGWEYHGEFFDFPLRNVVPKPFQKPHPPLWVACSQLETIVMAGERGLGALGFQFVSAEAARLKAEGKEIIDFSVGEPDFNTPENIKLKGHDAITKNFTKYPPAGGINDLREAVALKYRNQYGVDYSIAEVAISCGAKHTLFNLAFVLFEEGDEVLLPVPYWVTFPEQIKLVGAMPVEVQTHEKDNFILRAAALKEKLTPRTKAIIPIEAIGTGLPRPGASRRRIERQTQPLFTLPQILHSLD